MKQPRRDNNMDKDFGGTFRKLREGKNIKISAVCDSSISKSMISKFERNISSISISKFFYLLDKIHVRPAEYDLALNEFYPDGFQMLLSDATHYFFEKNTHMLQILSDKELTFYQEEKRQMSLLNHLMIEVMIAMLEERPLSKDKDFSPITSYLFNCENWGYYELVLYGNTMGRMKIENVLLFSKNLPSKTLLMSDSGQLYSIYINLMTNTLSLCINSKLKKDAEYFLKALDQLEIDDTMLFEKLLLKYYRGLYNIQFSQNPMEGRKAVSECLTILKTLNSSNLYLIFKNEVDSIQI